MNYPDHIDGRMIGSPSQPMLLTKATSCISGPQDAVILPEGFIKSDWEVELGMVIGSSALDVGEDEALRHVAGYCVVNDISERDEQINQGGQWIKGKSSPTFGPLGPWLVTADEVPEPQTLNLWLEINGERHQSANTSEMIYTCAYLVSYLSKFLRLLPGDVIATGTPGGVGASLRPPRYLRPGDVMHAFVEGLGEQVTPVVAASHDR
jgi:2,4-diketo-3-deoxy-L-fuconate hydrolase